MKIQNKVNLLVSSKSTTWAHIRHAWDTLSDA